MKEAVVALGTFDGVHLGHKRILSDAVSYAKKHGLKSIAVTFNPHPQQIIIPERGLKLLTTLSERKELINALGVDEVITIKFTTGFQKLSYKEFAGKYLVKKIKAAVVFAGYDFAFGHNRSGGVDQLKNLGREFGFKVKIVKPVKETVPAGRQEKHIVKSSLIRNLISRGNFNHAIHLLGHPFQITGRVIHGVGRGGGLGFHTANLKIENHKLLPQHGVYLGKTLGRKCVVNIGARPTFGSGSVEIEAHILNFSKNIYGKKIKLQLYKKIRDEIQFNDVEELKERIRKDIDILKRYVI
ncbi:MAG: riboflavin kinase / FMN adenylyltransferase [Candidatus Saganbacteria bacterium]|uniref:Riboflavin biosynthesis protein n=1 Tax=Candidatus Saganbacteria bacterium TaxID=2575572 RepID=A0A833P074_UNCSA|nr:MAG: riboflavin kinase / FMN adenylyltransferase [Candidatus Saganbacteria bacterium]